jgi:hypothetical protein
MPMSDRTAAVRPQRKLERTMTHSLIGADRTTHLKVLCVALVAAIAVVAIGLTARIADADTTRLVVKAGKPTTLTAHDATSMH